jgi:hypothetical protein
MGLQEAFRREACLSNEWSPYYHLNYLLATQCLVRPNDWPMMTFCHSMSPVVACQKRYVLGLFIWGSVFKHDPCTWKRAASSLQLQWIAKVNLVFCHVAFSLPHHLARNGAIEDVIFRMMYNCPRKKSTKYA